MTSLSVTKRQIVCTVLRLPSVYLLEYLYHAKEVQFLVNNEFIQEKLVARHGVDLQALTTCATYFGYMGAISLIALTFDQLMSLYAHILTLVLLILSHKLSAYNLDTVQEVDLLQEGYNLLEQATFKRLVCVMIVQLIVIWTCSWLMKTKHWIFSASLVPLIAHICCLEPGIAKQIHVLSSLITMFIVFAYMLRNIWLPFQIAGQGLEKFKQMLEQYSVIYVVGLLYRKAFIPSIYVFFWLSLFIYHLFSFIEYKDKDFNFKDRWVIMIFAMIADSCESPWSLIGLCYTVSYTAYWIHNGCKVYLVGFGGHVHDHTLYTGAIEGLTLFILAFQTGLLGLNRIEKIFSLSIVLFIVVSSMLQSLYEMTNPVLLTLSTAYNRNVLAHIKVLVFAFALIIIPIVMTYSLAQVFSSNIWILIISLSCLLTSLHTFGSLMIYVLFMFDSFRKEPWENLDDVVYCIHGFGHVLEFAVALSGVCFGGFDAIFSELSFSGSGIMLLHFYFNVWQSAKAGWQSVNRRRGAMQKITSLKQASKEELESFNDICAICFEAMTTARVTPCNHYFHASCLKKWLYVQDKCPMCHSVVVNNLKPDTQEKPEVLRNADQDDNQ